MNDPYAPCPCNSGKKLKFCCNALTKVGSLTQHSDELCRKCPVEYCYTIKNWIEIGEAPILVARVLPTNNYVVGVYLIDLLCLGVKDVFMKMNMSRNEFDKMAQGIGSSGDGLVQLSYEHARSIILGGLEYAARFGFAPHRDWEQAKALVEPTREFKRDVTFGGENGKPVYVQGPHDENIKETVRKVLSVGGKFVAASEFLG